MENDNVQKELINYFSLRISADQDGITPANILKYVESIETRLAKEVKCNEYLTKIIEAQKKLIEMQEDQIKEKD